MVPDGGTKSGPFHGDPRKDFGKLNGSVVERLRHPLKRRSVWQSAPGGTMRHEGERTVPGSSSDLRPGYRAQGHPSRSPRTRPRWRSHWVRSGQRIRRNSLLVRTLARPRWVCFAASPRPWSRPPDPRPEAGSRGPAGAMMRTMTGPRRRVEARAVPRTGTGGQPLWPVRGEPRAPGAPGGSSVPPASARACGSSGPDSGARAPPRPSRRTTPGGAGRPGCPVPPPRAGPAAA